MIDREHEQAFAAEERWIELDKKRCRVNPALLSPLCFLSEEPRANGVRVLRRSLLVEVRR